MARGPLIARPWLKVKIFAPQIFGLATLLIDDIVTYLRPLAEFATAMTVLYNWFSVPPRAKHVINMLLRVFSNSGVFRLNV